MSRLAQLVLPTLVLLALSCGTKPTTPPPEDAGINVGFIYVGAIGDYGWTKAHEDGRQYLENFGTKVHTTFAESVDPAKAMDTIDAMVDGGTKLVITTSFDFLQTAMAAPARHPGVTFLNCSGFKKGERFGTYQARIEETEYLSGMVAGLLTKNNKIGVVGAMKIYEQMVHINAFTLGVQAVNPNAQVIVRWVGFWFDPDKEAKAVPDLVNGAGVDVVKSFTDTDIPIKGVDALNTATKTVYSVAHANKDGCAAAPKTCLVSSFYNWGPLYAKLAEEVRTGTYPAQGRIDYVSLADLEVAGLSTFADAVPQAVRDQVLAKKKAITERTFNVFQGPIEFSDASTVPAGSVITDDQLICTSKFVKGITELAGPSCSVDADCKQAIIGLNNMTCTNGLCTMKDLSGCP